MNFYMQVRGAFPSRFAARWPNRTLADPGYYSTCYGQPVWIPSKVTAPAVGKLLGSWMPRLGFDGIYLDGYLDIHRAPNTIRWIGILDSLGGLVRALPTL